MTPLTVICDACVLYPAPLRDLLMHLALADLFRARWTDQIHEEWTRSLLANRPDLTAAQLQRTRDLMNQAVPDCLVAGYEPLMNGLMLPDPDDRHVLAAAIRAHADVIVTYNVADFPESCLRQFDVSAQHPDDFIVALFDMAQAAVCDAVRRQRASLKRPAKSVDQFLEILSQQQLRKTVERLFSLAHLL